MTAKCDNAACGDAEVEYDRARGTTYCCSCGKVLEENATVNEVAFAEGAQGQAVLIGRHVGAEGRVYAGVRLPGEASDENASFLKHGRQDIYQLKTVMRLSKNHAEEAVALFKLALQRNFVKGRKILNVSCVCLYIVCRTMRSPHMLIDFSEMAKVNVFKLGATYLALIRLTSIRLPLIDPSLYMHRFVGQLHFEERSHSIATTALRLVARMKRDWIVAGRRPSGLCGAAIIIASRMHNFFRSKEQVMRVVRISPQTLQKRLAEFRDTSASYLTVEEIDAGGGDEGDATTLLDLETVRAEDPPIVKKHRKQRQQKLAEAGDRAIDDAPDDLALSAVTDAPAAAASVGSTPRDVDLASSNLMSLAAASVEQELLDLSVVDDEELEQYLNSAEETALKTRLWEEANRDYLERQEYIRRMREENPAEFRKRFPWKVASEKRARKKDGGESAPAGDAAEAAGRALGKKSKKINYDVLKSMLGGDAESADTVMRQMTSDDYTSASHHHV